MKLSDVIGSWLEVNRTFVKELMANRERSRNIKFHYNDIYKEVHQSDQICFVLSTGRCGTKLLSKMFTMSEEVEDHHATLPEMYYFDRYAYENHKSAHGELMKMIDAARYELIRKSILVDKTYIETNNRITFFAYQLAELFPQAKFIHLIRNPISFVKSGVGRNWYEGDNYNNEGRIVPVGREEEFAKWPIEEKVAWLWNETNQFIHDFKSTLPQERVLTVVAEDLFKKPEVTRSIYDFIGVPSLSDAVISKTISKPVNKGKKSASPSLSEDQKKRVMEIAKINQEYYS
ncbi:sulfotransferase [bacterium SCSIO 12741]|nr:sulfotransferase [bacterium SCSIO 12741]